MSYFHSPSFKVKKRKEMTIKIATVFKVKKQVLKNQFGGDIGDLVCKFKYGNQSFSYMFP